MISKYLKESAHSRLQNFSQSHLAQFLGNKLFECASGYGEKPLRVIRTSFIITVIFAIIFLMGIKYLNWGNIDGEQSILVHSVVSSMESFTTLVHASPGEFEKLSARLVATTEAFFGALLIALFLFTLTRSIHR
ncbi:hypothetical protein [Halorussus caseinilyticus]|nr:hypothetical protein [Halorussus sp. DT72]